MEERSKVKIHREIRNPLAPQVLRSHLAHGLGDPEHDVLLKGLKMPGGTAVIEIRPDPQGSLLVWDGDVPLRFALFRERRFFKRLERRMRRFYEDFQPVP
jgi:hypothetical protein